MCGILGLIGSGFEELEFSYALRELSHRGPDDSGIKHFRNPTVFLGHTRLAVLDLSESGAQPMISMCDRYCLVFNGEIYNFQELSKDLNDSLHGCKSDTRIFLESIAHKGVCKTLGQVDGMFAFGLYDRKRNVITLGRDRFGEKPLYYGKVGGAFIFASQLKPIIKLFRRFLSINNTSISNFIKHSYIPSNATIFNEISQVEPGSFIEISLDRLQISPTIRYWSPEFKESRSLMSAEEGNQIFAQIFLKSVQLRCISDAPLGAFLSGGYDSTAVVAAMRENGVSSIKTFTIGFEDDGFNEAPFAQRISDYLDTDHTELYVPAKAALDIIPSLSKIYDEPFADVSQIPTFLLAQLARGHVKVVLSGDGGDELLGGYTRYTTGVNLWRKLSMLHPKIRRLGALLISSSTLHALDRLNIFLPEYYQVKNIMDRGKKIRRIVGSHTASDFYNNLISNEISPSEILRNPNDYSPTQHIESDGNFIAAMMYADMLNYLPGDILTKVDRASMANGLETRTPFLNKALYEFSQRVPFELLCNHGQGKILLKNFVHERVPRKLVARPKSGFGVPIEKWLRFELRSWVEDLLTESSLKDRGVFIPEKVRHLMSDHFSGKKSNHNALWSVIMLHQWMEEYNFSA
jgi:asparagine synthase (glutamine-hydrolysing)